MTTTTAPEMIHHSEGRALRPRIDPDTGQMMAPALQVAQMLARREHGRRGVVVTLCQTGWRGDTAYYQASVGVPAGRQGWYRIRDVHFAVYGDDLSETEA